MTVLWAGLPGAGEPEIPTELAPYVTRTPTGFRVEGDRASARDVYVWCGHDTAAVSMDLAALLPAVEGRGHQLRLSDFGLSTLLHSALVPVPGTAFEDVWLLSAGDVLELDGTSGSYRTSHAFDYPWIEAKSTGDREPDEARLLELLTAGTDRQLAEVGNEGVLMLSSGLDSPSVALALAEAGFSGVQCVTYRSGPDDPEPPIAASFCRRLGLRHEIVDLPRNQESTHELLLRFFERSPLPGTDQSQVPYVAALRSVGMRGAVLDGGGNDAYMSHFPSAHAQRKLRLRIPVSAVARPVRRLAPVDSPLNYLTRSRAEVSIPGRNLRQHHIDRLYGGAADVAGWWDRLSEETAALPDDDLFDVVVRRHLHAAQILLKQKLAATTFGFGARLPWCDAGVADYYFNLPAAAKYDTATSTQKVLVRRMLERYLDYDADAIGKHFFIFDGASFLRENRDFVLDEIEASPLWEPEGIRMVTRWLDQLSHRPLLWHAVLTVFMISGWSNHYPPAIAAVSRR